MRVGFVPLALAVLLAPALGHAGRSPARITPENIGSASLRLVVECVDSGDDYEFSVTADRSGPMVAGRSIRATLFIEDRGSRLAAVPVWAAANGDTLRWTFNLTEDLAAESRFFLHVPEPLVRDGELFLHFPSWEVYLAPFATEVVE